MEEIIAKTAKKLYLIMYPICMVAGAIFTGIGAYMATADPEDMGVIGWTLFALGAVIVVMSIVYTIYFAKMPTNAITFKDDKLHFSNGTVCSPTEVNTCRAAGGGLDGAMFDFGKLFVTVNGKEFKIKFVQNVSGVVNRIYMLKAQYEVKENIARQQATQQPAQSQDNSQENK